MKNKRKVFRKRTQMQNEVISNGKLKEEEKKRTTNT